MSNLHFFSRFNLLACASTAVLLAGVAGADAAMVNFENFNYTGSVVRYDTAADAQNGVNATGTYSISTATSGSNSTLPNARDAYVYADTSTSEFYFGTSWYFTPQDAERPDVGGWGNPNNSNNGFVQLYDSDGSSVSALSLGWDATLTDYSIHATGQDAGASEYARFWPADSAGGAASTSGGTFLDYVFDMTASFGSSATSPTLVGVTPDTVTGSFMALFENTGTDPFYNGFYLISLLFGNGSVAALDDYASPYSGYTSFSQVIADTAFIAPVPLPAAGLLAIPGLALFGLFGVSRRRRTSAAA